MADTPASSPLAAHPFRASDRAERSGNVGRPSRPHHRGTARPRFALSAHVAVPTVTAAVVVVWAVGLVLFEPMRLLVHAPQAQVAVESVSAVYRMFAALVLVLIAQGEAGTRLRWAALGLVVLAVGNLGFGSLWPMLLAGAPDANASIYASLFVSSVAGLCFAAGFALRQGPRFSSPLVATGAGVVLLLGALLAVSGGALPTLARIGSLEAAAIAGRIPMQGLTPWHWGLTAIPLLLAAAAAIGAVRHGTGEGWGRWLGAAMALQVGALLHNALWPSAYSSVLTSSSLLRLAFAVAVAVGGTLELRRLAAVREALLALEREHAAGLVELADLKADFSRMVAHELVSPIAAIRAYATILASRESQAAEHDRALAAIQVETDLLHSLVHDVRAIATVERDAFAVDLRPTAVNELLAEAADSNRTLPGHHPLLTVILADEEVLADPARIKQVLRNLIGNAAKYSPAGTSIELRALRHGPRVRIEVVDHGPGIPDGEAARIFEKFARGSRDRRRVPGFGLGLYLSSRIVDAHGGRLTVTTTPGGGATFGFDLEIVAAPLPADTPLSAWPPSRIEVGPACEHAPAHPPVNAHEHDIRP